MEAETVNTLQSIAHRGGSATAAQVMEDTSQEHEQTYAELVHHEASGVLRLDGREWVMESTMVEAVARLNATGEPHA